MSSTGQSGRDAAYEHLITEVLADPANAGRFISEQDVASALGISRTPVREAFMLLNAEGFIDLIPRRGAQVPDLGPRQVRSLIEFRTVLETSSAATVVAAGAPPTGEMRRILGEQAGLAELNDPESSRRFIELDSNFHLALIQAAGNEYVEKAYQGIRTLQRLVGTEAIFAIPNRRRDVCDEHMAIVRSLEAGDATAAVAAIREHLIRTMDILLGK